MNKRTRLIFLVIALFLLVVVGHLVSGGYDFLLNDFWFTSGLLLLILLSLIGQPYFSKDSDIFMNAVVAGVSILLVDEQHRDSIFWLFLLVTSYLVVSSYILMLIRGKALHEENCWTQLFSRMNREIGKPQTLFSAFFIWGAINQFGVNSKGFSALFLYWLVFMLLNIPSIASTINKALEKKKDKKGDRILGKILSVQSKNVFLAKLLPERKATMELFGFVEFVHSIDESKQIRKGLILDAYLLNAQQWIKILATNDINKVFDPDPIYSEHKKDFIYKIEEEAGAKYLSTFVGVVAENSTIEKIRFIYNSKVVIQEGQLLEVKIGENGKPVFYQIIEGATKIEVLEDKNETGLVIGEAVQLGSWDNEQTTFEKYGWVPEINSPVHIVSKTEKRRMVSSDEFQIGNIPGTNFPVILDKATAITHHTAILGITGSGKSVFSRNLVREYLRDKTVKVICIDFTGEYNKKLSVPLGEIVSEADNKVLYAHFEWISRELEKFGNQQKKECLKTKGQEIRRIFESGIKKFLENERFRASIVELPDVSNTESTLEYTRQLFKALFHIAKTERNNDQKICVVLEEAHTVIPEWNSVGIAQKPARSLLNSIAQIALQGRKYNVGLLVIAQRTANVSKTVLTQCNTIISFQEIDKTSSEFLSNYFGQSMADTLPNLQFRQAVVVGKALKSNVPLIFEVPEIDESQEVDNQT